VEQTALDTPVHAIASPRRHAASLWACMLCLVVLLLFVGYGTEPRDNLDLESSVSVMRVLRGGRKAMFFIAKSASIKADAPELLPKSERGASLSSLRWLLADQCISRPMSLEAQTGSGERWFLENAASVQSIAHTGEPLFVCWDGLQAWARHRTGLFVCNVRSLADTKPFVTSGLPGSYLILVPEADPPPDTGDPVYAAQHIGQGYVLARYKRADIPGNS
jgi:hypothetical protein